MADQINKRLFLRGVLLIQMAGKQTACAILV